MHFLLDTEAETSGTAWGDDVEVAPAVVVQVFGAPPRRADSYKVSGLYSSWTSVAVSSPCTIGNRHPSGSRTSPHRSPSGTVASARYCRLEATMKTLPGSGNGSCENWIADSN
jgi:hypothetical protein